MASDHPSEERLIAFVDDPKSLPDRVAIEAHLDRCAECWMKVDDYRTLASSMRSEETWWAFDELLNGGGQNAVREFEARIAFEDSEADRLLAPIIESQYLFEAANILRKKRFYGGGVIRRLSREARAQCDREPLYALTLAEVAATMAEALPDDYYPAAAVNELRGTAWKEYSTACLYLGRYSKGLEALMRAERAYKRLPDSAGLLAAVELGRASLLWKQQRYDEALPVARLAGRMFSEVCDTVRYFDAKQVEAVILQRMGDMAAACETYRLGFDLADTIDDPEMKARAAKNLGLAALDSGDIGTASKFLIVALQVYESLERTRDVVRTRWSIACVALAAGNFHGAVENLRRTEADMVQLGMLGDTALLELDLAEALLMLGRVDEVQAVCAALIAVFRQANMLASALTAAAFLKEAASQRALTRTDIEFVRGFLLKLEANPNLPFAPPPDIL